jgi:hypothetical protein
MIFQTRRLLAAALVFAAPSLFAAFPSARTGPRMVYDEAEKVTVLFGGVTTTDLGTSRAYALDETWLWTGERWIQQHPAQKPPGRDSHAMVYDAARQRVILFGGRGQNDELNDTWAYAGGVWTRIETPSAPPARILAGMTYDSTRDRVVLYGGTTISDDGTVVTSLKDMWEFDGAEWSKVLDEGPAVSKPLMFYDESREQMVMLGVADDFSTRMYVYDVAANSWNQITPTGLPPCVNEASAIYRKNSGTAFLLGGVCAVEGNQSGTTEQAFWWDGSEWRAVLTETAILRVTNAAVTHDTERDEVVIYGGTTAFGAPRQSTYTFQESDWEFFSDASSPGPRSLFGLATDPVNKITWVLGGLTDLDFFADFWKFENHTWQKIVIPEDATEKGPECATPLAAYDTDRQRLVVVCTDSTTFEWDGTVWREITTEKKPPARRFGNLAYDPSMRKTVLFGGFDEEGEYTGRTWLYDGTNWSELKKKKPHSRALASMWYDPTLRKTVLFGGVGRRDRDAKIERYTDMWTLDANGWSEIKPATLPTTRYGAQVAVDPRTGRAILFGGIRLDIETTEEREIQRQVYADDTWEWDGTTWRQLAPSSNATPRENGALFYDPSTEKMTLFAGWAGYYHSDLWTFEENAWKPVVVVEEPTPPNGRRRIAH